MTTIAIIAPYFALIAYYIVLEKRESFWPATILKVILTAYAASCCVYAAALLDNYIFSIFALGLLCAVPADYFLQYIKTDLTKYRIGISLFSVMHICLIVSFYLMWKVTFYEFAVFALLIAILLVFQIQGKWKMGKEKAQLMVYIILVVFMSAKAISLYIISPSTYTLMAFLGGLFFYVSDLILGIWAYSASKFAYLALNRITYFVGQLCLAFYLLIQVL